MIQFHEIMRAGANAMNSLKEDILNLVALKQEGAYWDFKREWHDNNADLLHDIICMANNLESRDGYIIFGIDEENDYGLCSVNNDSHRKNTQNMVDFLRDKHFAGGIRPTIRVETQSIDDVEIDVLIICFDRHTPYFLTEQYMSVNANNIYTRIQDSNTPKNKSADVHHIELLWKRRFGMDASIYDRYLLLLDQYDQWECDFGNFKPAFHKVFPEFRVEADNENARTGWEPQGMFFLHTNMGFTPIKLLYYNTVIYECGIMDIDGANLYLPYPKRKMLQCKHDANFFYDYYDLSKIEGKLLRMMTAGTLCCDSGVFNTKMDLFLIFNNDEEREGFDIFAADHYDEVDLNMLKQTPRISIALDQAKKENHDENQVLKVAVASELYSLWMSRLCEIGKYPL